MRIHLFQLDMAWEDKPSNHRLVRSLVDGVEIGAGDLVVLPEMFDTGFSVTLDRVADDEGVSQRFVADLARDTRAFVIAGIAVRGENGRGLNRSLVCGPDGGLMTHYDKVHPFTFGREGEQFDAGTQVETFDWTGPGGGEDADMELRVCPTICYDLRFPELYRRGLDMGAQAYTVIANWPSTRREHWRTLALARAIENQAYVFAVNRAGRDPHLRYAGGSIVVDPRGEVLAEAGASQTVLSVEVDASRVSRWREAFGAWRDRRL